MKKCSKLAGMIVLISMVISAPAISDTGVRVKVGLSHIAYGDYNDVVDLVNENSAVSGLKVDNISWVPEICGEVFYSPVPMLTVALGAGMINGSSESSSDFFGDFEHKVKVYPMTVTAYFKPSLPLMPIKPYVYAGAGMYYSKLTFSYSRFWKEASQLTEADLTKSGFGLHGGAGLEFSIMPMLSLQVGVQGRWAEIKGFEGTGTNLDGDKVDVFLLNDEFEVEYEGQTETMHIHSAYDAKYKDDYDYDEGVLDLTGYGFIVGLKLSF